MTEATKATHHLDKLNIPYTFFQHPGKVHSLEQAAEERGQQPEQVIRSLLFRVSRDEFLLVLVAGPQQIDWKALRHYLGQSRLTMAKPEEVLAVTGYQIGAVSPFGIPQPLRILVDETVFMPDEISIGSGLHSSTIILKTADLKRALGVVEVVQL